MKKNDLLFVLAILVIALLVTELARMVSQDFAKYQGKYLMTVYARCIIITLTCWFIAKRYHFSKLGGYSGAKTRNYWMLLIPIIYPAMIFSKQVFSDCNLGVGRIVLIFLYFLSNGLTEEVLFRGTIHGYLRKRFPTQGHFSQSMVAAGFFALIHLYNLRISPVSSVMAQIIFSFFGGLLFSALLIRVGNIWLLGLTHGLVNMIISGCSRFSEGPVVVSGSGDGSNVLADLLVIALVFSPMALFSWGLLATIPRKKINGSLYIEKP